LPVNALVSHVKPFFIKSEKSASSQYDSSCQILAEAELYRLGWFLITLTILVFTVLHYDIKHCCFIPQN